MFSFTKIILIATCIVAVLSKPPQSPSEEKSGLVGKKVAVVPSKSRYLAQESPVVFGEDVEGASEIFNSQESYSQTEKNAIILVFEYPPNFMYPIFKSKKIITKIVVEVDEIDDDDAFEVDVLEGGIGKTSVRLTVVAENSRKLTSRVKIYGVKK